MQSKATPCPCSRRLPTPGDCPVCYGHGTIIQPSIPLKTTGEVLSEEIRWQLIQLAVRITPSNSPSGTTVGRLSIAQAAQITDQTLVRALKGGAISLPVIRRLGDLLKDSAPKSELELRHGRLVEKSPTRPINLRGATPQIHGRFVADELEGAKRLYMAGVKVTANCPWCGGIASRDLGEVSLSYPAIGKPFDLLLVCQTNSCRKDATEGTLYVRVQLDIALSLTSDPVAAEFQ